MPDSHLPTFLSSLVGDALGARVLARWNVITAGAVRVIGHAAFVFTAPGAPGAPAAPATPAAVPATFRWTVGLNDQGCRRSASAARDIVFNFCFPALNQLLRLALRLLVCRVFRVLAQQPARARGLQGMHCHGQFVLHQRADDLQRGQGLRADGLAPGVFAQVQGLGERGELLHARRRRRVRSTGGERRTQIRQRVDVRPSPQGSACPQPLRGLLLHLLCFPPLSCHGQVTRLAGVAAVRCRRWRFALQQQPIQWRTHGTDGVAPAFACCKRRRVRRQRRTVGIRSGSRSSRDNRAGM